MKKALYLNPSCSYRISQWAFLIFLCLSCFSTLFSQNEWQLNIPTDEYLTKVAVAPNGNYVTAGLHAIYTVSPDGNLLSAYNTSGVESVIVMDDGNYVYVNSTLENLSDPVTIVKITPNGDKIWETTGNSGPYERYLTHTSDDNILLTMDVGGNSWPISVAIKYSTDGDYLGGGSLNNMNFKYGAVIETKDKGFVIGGTKVEWVINSGGFWVMEYRPQLVKIDSTGTIVWWKVMTNLSGDSFISVEELSSGNILAVGGNKLKKMKATGADLATYTLPIGWSQIVLADEDELFLTNFGVHFGKIDTSGNVLFTKDTGFDAVYYFPFGGVSITKTPDGGAIIAM